MLCADMLAAAVERLRRRLLQHLRRRLAEAVLRHLRLLLCGLALRHTHEFINQLLYAIRQLLRHPHAHAHAVYILRQAAQSGRNIFLRTIAAQPFIHLLVAHHAHHVYGSRLFLANLT